MKWEFFPLVLITESIVTEACVWMFEQLFVNDYVNLFQIR
jgi:hypothetical protein